MNRRSPDPRERQFPCTKLLSDKTTYMKGTNMPEQTVQNRPDFREKAKEYYRDKKNIAAKWLDQYGNVNRDDDYQRNRACLSEVFNMLDVVMENCIDDFRHTHVLIQADVLEPRKILYTYEGDHGETIQFRTPGTFAGRISALRSIGYAVSDELFFGTRFLRNETTHGNQTIILQHMQLSFADTIKALLSMADALIELDMLDPALRTPTFDMLRVHTGDTLANGAYQIGDLIGEGGTSRVYKAVQTRIGREIAVKELKPETWSDELIRNECDILLRLHHELIPQVHDIFYENSTWYIAMSYIDGDTLDHLSSDLSKDEKLFISQRLLDVLAYLHSPKVNIVFADLSPDNIMIDSERQPHLIDFGISIPAKTRQSLPAATLGYSAPEVFSGQELDQRSDIYSFGYILRFLFTGLSPQMEAETPTYTLVSDRRIADVINRCTSRNPEERYGDIADLKNSLFPETIKSSQAAQEEIPARDKRIIKKITFGFVLSLIVIIPIAMVMLLKSRFSRTSEHVGVSESVSSTYSYEGETVPYAEAAREEGIIPARENYEERRKSMSEALQAAQDLMEVISKIPLSDMDTFAGYFEGGNESLLEEYHNSFSKYHDYVYHTYTAAAVSGELNYIYILGYNENELPDFTENMPDETESDLGVWILALRKMNEGWRIDAEMNRAEAAQAIVETQLEIYPAGFAQAIRDGLDANCIPVDRNNLSYLDEGAVYANELTKEVKFIWQDVEGNVYVTILLRNGTDEDCMYTGGYVVVNDTRLGLIAEAKLPDDFLVSPGESLMETYRIPSAYVLTGSEEWYDVYGTLKLEDAEESEEYEAV